MSTGDFIRHWAQAQSGRRAAVSSGKVLSYGQLASALNSLRDRLGSAGLPPGSTGAVIVSSILDGWLTVLALQELGLDTLAATSIEGVQALRVRHLSCVVIDAGKLAAGKASTDLGPGVRVLTLESLVESPAADCSPAGRPTGSDTRGGHILYTSGTTGVHKKLRLGGEKELQRVRQRQLRYRIGPDTVWHGANLGLWTGAGYKTPPAVWQAGGCMVFDQRKDWPANFFEQAITDSLLVPYLVDELLNAAREPAFRGPQRAWHLTVMGGFLTNRQAREIGARLTMKIGVSYSATELGAPVLQQEPLRLDDMHWLDAVPGRTVEVVDDLGRRCEPGNQGWLRVKLDALDCAEYLEDGATTARVFRDGYFHPGDLAEMRADGRIRVLGRSTDVLNVQGRKIAAAPMEEWLQEKLGVQTVCLFTGVSPAGDSELTLAVEPGGIGAPDPGLIQETARRLVGLDEVKVVTLASFPRTAQGMHKVDRRALRQLLYMAPRQP